MIIDMELLIEIPSIWQERWATFLGYISIIRIILTLRIVYRKKE